MSQPEPEARAKRGDIVAIKVMGGWTVGVVLRSSRKGWATHVEPWHIDLDRWNPATGLREDLKLTASNRLEPGRHVAVIGPRSDPAVRRMLTRLSVVCHRREVFPSLPELREAVRR